MRFSSTVRPGKMPRASGTSSTPSRARRNDRACGDVVPSRQTVPSVGSTTPGGDRAERRLAGAVGAEQRDDLARRRGAGRRRGAPRRRRTRRRSRRIASARHRVESSAPSVGARLGGVARRRCRVDALVLRHHAVVHRGLGRGDARLRAAFSRFFAQLLLADEGEDAVGLLRELDGPEARQDRHEVDRREERRARRRRRGATRSRSSGRPRCRRRTRSRRGARRRAGGCRTSPPARARRARRSSGRGARW